MSERLTLAMDGATTACTTALLRADDPRAGVAKVVSSRSVLSGRGQAQILLRMVDEMLDEAGATPADIGAVVVGIGPGTFTGVRVAVATARGLALGLGVPVFGVSTLSALAASGLRGGSGTRKSCVSAVVPVIDARRHQVFSALYAHSLSTGANERERWIRQGPISVCDQGRLVEGLERTEGRVVVVGADRDLVGELPPGAEFVRSEVMAEELVLGKGLVVEDETMNGHAVGDPHAGLRDGAPEAVRPIYVRAPDADVHIIKMKDPWADAGTRR